MEVILFTSIAILFLFIVISHKLLTKKITGKFERQNQRLAASKKREIKMLQFIQKITKYYDL